MEIDYLIAQTERRYLELLERHTPEDIEALIGVYGDLQHLKYRMEIREQRRKKIEQE